MDLADARAKLASLREKVAMQEKVIEQQQERIHVRLTVVAVNFLPIRLSATVGCCTGTGNVSTRCELHGRSYLPCISICCLTCLQDLEQSTKQLDSRCAELREAANGHEHRGKEAAAQVVKCNGVIERLTADLQTSKDKLKRKQVIIVRQV